MKRYVRVNCEGISNLSQFSTFVEIPQTREEIEIPKQLCNYMLTKNLVSRDSKLIVSKHGDSLYEVSLNKQPIIERVIQKVKDFFSLIGTEFHSLEHFGEPPIHDVDTKKFTPEVYNGNLPTEEEKSCLENGKKRRVAAVNLFLNSHFKEEREWFTSESCPVIGLSHGIGGPFAEISALGAIFALIDCNLMPAVSYHSGASGGSWAVALAASLNFSERGIRERLDTLFRNTLMEEFKENLKNERNLEDIFRRVLEEHFDKNFTLNFTLEEFQENMRKHHLPIPLFTSARILEKSEEMKRESYHSEESAEIMEFSPFWAISEYTHVKIDTKAFHPTLTDLMLNSSYAVSVTKNTLLEFFQLAKKTSKTEDTFFSPVRYRNYFREVHMESGGRLGVEKHFPVEDVISLTDAGEVCSFPVLPFLRRGCDLLIVTSVDQESVRQMMARKLLERMYLFQDELKTIIPMEKLKAYGYEPMNEPHEFKINDKKPMAEVVIVNPLVIKKDEYYRKECYQFKYGRDELDKYLDDAKNYMKESLGLVAQSLKMMSERFSDTSKQNNSGKGMRMISI